MASHELGGISAACRSIDESLENMREHISQIQTMRAELARERSYREFVERMLGYSLASVVDYVTSGEKRREVVAGQVLTLVQKLQECHFGRFINTTTAANREEFLRESLEGLDEKHKEASFDLGISHYYGIGVDADHTKSFQIFKTLYESGYSDARSWFARCLFFGTGVEANKAEAIRLLRMDADEGKPEGQRMLGLCLRDCGDDASLAEAARYFKMAADHMDTDSQCLYAQCLKDGEGVDKNIEEAARYFKMAADHGNSNGQIAYALLLHSGKPAVEKEEAMMRYGKMALRQGNRVAMRALGHYLASGEERAKYLKMAADLGDAGGLWMYGFLLMDSSIPHLVEEGARCIKTPADRGCVLGAFMYGCCLYEGEKVAQDRSEAARYFKLCADTGEAVFQVAYGMCLYDSAENRNEAAQYFKKAAEQDDPYGQCLYGLCLFSGDGVEMDRTEAARYFRAADRITCGRDLNQKCSRNQLQVNQGDVLRVAKISLLEVMDIVFDNTRAAYAVREYDNMFEMAGLKKMRADWWRMLIANTPTRELDVQTPVPVRQPESDSTHRMGNNQKEECQVA